MEWNDLSNEAKSFIEWVEHPFTSERLTVEVKLNNEFVFPKSFYDMPKSVMVTKNVFDEVLNFVTEDEELQCEQFSNGFTFKIKDDSELKLH